MIRMQTSNGAKGGFTLIEILVYVAVLVILILAISYFLLWTIRSNVKSAATRETADNATAILEKMAYEIKEASSIYTPTSIFSATSGQLSLETTKYLPSGESASYIDFYVCGKSVCLKKEGEAPIALTSSRVKVNKLEFFQISTTSTAPSVQIGLGVSYDVKTAKPEYQASFNTTSTVSLRSY
ncbi:MAG: type II secretion system protein [Candidatus Wildermuthbacteria bacterium]|nr:type II secretion system protein [Candidatus Wildermuthbacteria bacterium]